MSRAWAQNVCLALCFVLFQFEIASAKPGALLPTILFSYVDLSIHENLFGSLNIGAVKSKISCRATAPVPKSLLEFELQYTDAACPEKLRFKYHRIAKDRYKLEIRMINPPKHPGLKPLLRVQLGREDKERILGFGEQFSVVQWQNQSVWTVVREQGTGRGDEPITSIMRTLASPSEGHATATYAPSPYFLSTGGYAFMLKNKEPARFDFKSKGRSIVDVLATELEAEIHYGQGLESLMQTRQKAIGRAPRLPDWIHQGLIAGGFVKGEANLKKMISHLKEEDIPVSALFIEDWCGYRQTVTGSRLWWHWELDKNLYPNWHQITGDLRKEGVRTMGYFNPLLTDAGLKVGAQRNFLKEATEKEYLIRNAKGGIHENDLGGLKGALVDLTNPKAYKWLKEIIGQQIQEAGLDVWLADFGESIMSDNQLYAGNGLEQKNQYVELWAKLNREVVNEYGTKDSNFIMRAGYLDTARYVNLHWMGDQNASFGKHDGLESTLTAFLTGGLSGMLVNHSDIAGILNFPVPGFKLRRTRELYLRWMEMNAFSPIFRTKEGFGFSSPLRIFEDPILRKSLAHWTKVFAAFFDYRKGLMDEAYDKAMPVVRPMFLEFPQWDKSWDITSQYMLGSEVLVAPVVERGSKKKMVHLPPGDWVHLWSGEKYVVEGSYLSMEVNAPIGQPPVFVKANSQILKSVRLQLSSLSFPSVAAELL